MSDEEMKKIVNNFSSAVLCFKNSFNLSSNSDEQMFFISELEDFSQCTIESMRAVLNDKKAKLNYNKKGRRFLDIFKENPNKKELLSEVNVNYKKELPLEVNANNKKELLKEVNVNNKKEKHDTVLVNYD